MAFPATISSLSDLKTPLQQGAKHNILALGTDKKVDEKSRAVKGLKRLGDIEETSDHPPLYTQKKHVKSFLGLLLSTWPKDPTF